MKKLKLDLEGIQGYNHYHAPFDFSEEEKVQGKVVDVNAAIPKPMVENTNTTVNPTTLEIDSYTREVEDSNRELEAAIEALKTNPSKAALEKLKAAYARMTEVISQEACTSCQNAAQSVGHAFNQSGQQGTSSFQYAETSDKEKEVIMLTGPLGEAYTHALNVKFHKKPLFTDNTLPRDLSESEQDLLNESATASVESQQQDHDEGVNLVAALDFIEAKKEEVANTFTFIDQNTVGVDASDTTGTVAVIGTADDLFNPEQVEEICDSAKKRKNVIVVCHVPTDLANAGIRIKEDFLDLNAVNPHADMRKRLRSSLCSVYSSENIKVILGMEDLGYHLLENVQG